MNTYRPPIQDDDRTRALAQRASPAIGGVTPAQATVQRLQQMAGNRATGAYVRAQLTATHGLQRFGLEDIKDAYQHFQAWRHRNDPPKPEEVEDWSEHSDEVALHAKQALGTAQAAYGYLASQAKAHGDTRALEEAERASERLEKAAGYLESAEKVFKTSVKTIKIIQQCDEMWEAAKTLNSTDLGDPRSQQQAAEAIDKLAGGFGQLGSEVLPGTPAKGYFDFLSGFSSARFFAHWTEFIHDYTGRIDAASRSD